MSTRNTSSSPPSSSPTTSPAFVEGLVYSQQTGGKHHVFGSLARLTQELGAELCGRLSYAALQTLPLSLSAAPHVTSACAPNSSSPPSSSSPSFMDGVQRGLSAHYGAHAVRRGLAKPFGPCVHPALRKGNLTLSRAGVHGPLYMRLWRMRRVRQCWCLRCGVWLTRGTAATKTTTKAKTGILATVKECRVLQHPLSRRRSTRRRATREAATASGGKFTACCVRCLENAHKAAMRKATPLTEKVVTRGTATDAKTKPTLKGVEKAKSVCQQRAEATEKAVTAVVAAARVPKRNRRARRKSARRPRKAPQTSGKKKGQTTPSANTTSATAAAAAADAAASTASTTAHLRHVLAAKIVSKKTATSVATGVNVSPVKAATAATAAPKPPAIKPAQKSLQGLVPTGPLKKQKRSAASAAAATARAREAPDGPAQALSSTTGAATATTAATTSTTAHPAVSIPLLSLTTTTTTTQPPPAAVVPHGAERKAAKTDPPRPRSAATTVGNADIHMDKPALRTAATEYRSLQSSSSDGPSKQAGVSSSPQPQKAARVSLPHSVPSPPPSLPKGPPTKAMPQKLAKAPVKAHTKGAGKAKLMDAMNQLGF